MSTLAEPGLALHAYLLGTVQFEAALRLQRRLHFEVSGDRTQAGLILCEHPPLITVGRHGSRAHILFEPDELRQRQWPIRWVNRGGGSLLHLPGQLAIYPILPLDRLGLGVQAYLDHLHQVVQDLLDDFGIRGELRPGQAGVWAHGRLLAAIGVAVRDWVSYYGIYLNVHPSLGLFRHVRPDAIQTALPDLYSPSQHAAMTSLERERRGPLRPSLVRELFMEHFQAHFPCCRVSLFSDHPCLDGEQQRCHEPLRTHRKTTYS
jgi:lipoyl(octanoyl) transferase